MTNDPTQPPEDKGAPDIRAAIGHALQAAADLVGKDRVSEFFEGMVGEIVKRRWPIDPGELVNSKVRSDVHDKINELLQ